MIHNITKPFHDEYFLGWLIRMSWLNAYTHLEDFLADLMNAECKLSINKINSITMMIGTLASCVPDLKLNTTSLIKSATLYDFYKHFVGEAQLQYYLSLAYSHKSHWETGITANDASLKYCDHCDSGYFKTVNQIPGISCCLECSRPLKSVDLSANGTLTEHHGFTDEPNIELSKLLADIYSSVYTFDFRSIKHLLYNKYCEVLEEYHYKGNGYNQFVDYLRKKGMDRFTSLKYPDAYFTNYMDVPFETVEQITDVISLIRLLFGSYDHFIASSDEFVKTDSKIIAPGSDFGLYGTVIEQNNDLLKVIYPCGASTLKCFGTLNYATCSCSKCRLFKNMYMKRIIRK